MVKDPRAKTRPGQIRALNLPGRVEVEEDDERGPMAVGLGRHNRLGPHSRKKQRIASIEDVWEIEDEWWRPRPVSRRYYRVLLEEGPAVTLFLDKVDGLWYRQQA